MVRRLLLVLAIAMLALPASAMADRYAAPGATGEPAFCIEKANPCSLEKALPLAQKGETVWLAEGTYEPVGELTVPEEFVTVSGESSQKPPLIMAKGSTGLNVEQTLAAVRDLRIHSTAATAVGLRLSLGSTAERVESSGTPQMACLLGTSTMRSSLCQTSGGRGVVTSLSFGSSLEFKPKLFNVTAVGSVAGIEADAGGQAAVNIYAKSTIAVGHVDVITDSSNPGGAGVNVNLSHSNFDTTEALGETFITSNAAEGNQSAAPVFVDEAVGNYRETSTSPTRLAGTLQELAGGFDLDGNPRTRTCEEVTKVDIGAYQFQETCPPPKEPGTPEEHETPKEPETPGGGSGSGGSGNSDSGGSTGPVGSTQGDTVPPAPAPVAPRLSALTLKPRRFAKRTTIGFTLSAPASVKLEVLATRRGKGKKPRLVTLGQLTKNGVAGPNKLGFNGRLKGKPLAPGTYTLRASAAGSSVTTTFTITAR